MYHMLALLCLPMGTDVLCFTQATTPMDPRVLDTMLPFMTEQFGNPHSKTHAYGWEAEAAVDVARQVSHLFHII